MKKAFFITLLLLLASAAEAQWGTDSVFRTVFARQTGQLSIDGQDVLDLQGHLKFAPQIVLKEIGVAKIINRSFGLRYSFILPYRETADGALPGELTFKDMTFGSKDGKDEKKRAITSEFFFASHRLNLDWFVTGKANQYLYPTFVIESVMPSFTFKGTKSSSMTSGTTTGNTTGGISSTSSDIVEVSDNFNRILVGGGLAGHYSDRYMLIKYEAMFLGARNTKRFIADIGVRYKGQRRGFAAAGYRYSDLSFSIGNGTVKQQWNGPYVEVGLVF